MTLSKFTLATASIFIMGISLAACTGSKPYDSSLRHDYAGCISVPEVEQEEATTTDGIPEKAQRRKTSSSKEPAQDSADCILVPDS
ncbi:MAG TPA: hypothetical protein EYP59_13240 [Thiotrichaceae bacterium]|nr:hypothetical protein [Thiotrichaceae bacterium]